MSAIIVAAVTLLPGIARADYTFNEGENARFLHDLNSYTLRAAKIVIYGKTANVYPDRTGPVVTFIGRGPLIEVAGTFGYKANFVVVGHPCLDCTPRVTLYHVASEGPAEVIADYSLQQH